MIKNLIISLLIFLFSLLIAYLASEPEVLIAGLPNLIAMATIIFVIQWLVFIPAFVFQTEKFYDLTGSITYLTAVIISILSVDKLDIRSIVLACLIGIWAMRLGSFLFVRVFQDGGDGRFDKIKPSFSRFLLTWTLQGLWVFLTAVCALTALGNSGKVELGLVGFIGIAIWILGFAIEVISDSQKRKFRANPAKETPFIITGLWAYSRHPNYFGEVVLWMGIAIVALPTLSGLQYITLISPIFVYLLLTKVSGIPLLEQRADARWGDNKTYIKYRDSTPILIPKLKKPKL
jgi:steroid 5-alpha reductase family enzyme